MQGLTASNGRPRDQASEATKMIRPEEVKSKFLAGTIALLRRCSDAGQRLRDDPDLEPEARCDLCGCKPPSGQLLVGNLGLGQVHHDDGRIEFDPWPVEDPRDAMYWICLPCFGLLTTDPEALLRRLLEAHGTPRN
jgi:hypothetical protein